MMSEELEQELKARREIEERKVKALEAIADSLDHLDGRITRLVDIAEDAFQLYERR